MRVADYVADFVYKLGVEEVFFVTGAGIMHLTDGVACHEKLDAICVHHEQSASMAVETYARASENFGVAYFTTGPGATNAVTGLVGAWQDSVPCLYISGQVKRSQASLNEGVDKLRQFGVQELNIIPIVESVSKYAIMLNDPNEVRYELEKAVAIAKSGRPGPVWIDIPMDVQAAKIEVENLRGFDEDLSRQDQVINAEEVKQAADLIAQAKRPVIIAGQGVRLSGAVETLQSFCEKRDIPVVTPYLGIDSMYQDHPNYVGKSGIKGDRPANFAMQNSDLVLSIGSSLHTSVIGYDYEAFAREAKTIIVDIDLTSHKKKTIQIDKLIKSDAKQFIKACDELLGEYKSSKDWSQRCQQWKSKYKVCLPEYASTKDAINIYSFIDELSKASGEGDIFISDAGSAFYAVSQGLLLKNTQRYITSGGLATMGFSLPAAIGAYYGRKNKSGTILAITGDGSLQQNIQELQVLKEYTIPVKLFVLNNDGYLSIRKSQKNYFDSRLIGEGPESGVSFPDTLELCKVYGLEAKRFESLEDLKKGLPEVLTNDKPVVIDVICPPMQEIIPTVSSKVNADGTMSSRPLEDMAPFLEREEYLSNLLIPEV